MTKTTLSIIFVMTLLTAGAANGHPRGLSETFGPGVAGQAGGVAAGTGLIRVDVNTRRFPRAACGDGTNAVFYVRRYTGHRNRDRWVLFLQGGGGCFDGEECANRWLNHGTQFGAQKLSSDFAPTPGIAGRGIQKLNNNNLPENNFADWNQVFLYYCSSDFWSGRGHNVVTSIEDPTNPGAQIDYVIHFNGANILDAVVKTLRRANGFVTYADPVSGDRKRMPDLDSASDVLFTGSSAGGMGVSLHADRLYAELESKNLRCRAAKRLGRPCPLTYAAVLDSVYPVALDNPDIAVAPGGPLCAGLGLCSYQDIHEFRADIYANFWHGRVDQSCLDYHKPLGDRWRCADSTHVMDNHITVPKFMRMDLQDGLLMGNFLPLGFTYRGQPVFDDPAGALLFGELVHDQLENYGFNAPEEPTSGFGHLDIPGVFAPQCTDHETLRDNAAFLQQTVPGLGGVEYTTNDVLANWLWGIPPPRVIRDFTVAGEDGTCP